MGLVQEIWTAYWALNGWWQLYYFGVIIGELLAAVIALCALADDPQGERGDLLIMAGAVALIFTPLWPIFVLVLLASLFVL